MAELTCRRCFEDIEAAVADGGGQLTCPSCGTESAFHYPADLELPPKFIYMQTKADKYLKVGPETYRGNDYFGLPPVFCTPEALEHIALGMQQLSENAGTCAEKPMVGISLSALTNVVTVLHFEVTEVEEVTGSDGGPSVRCVRFTHVVSGETTTLHLVPSDSAPDPLIIHGDVAEWTGHSSLEQGYYYDSGDEYFEACTPRLYAMGAHRRGSRPRAVGILDEWVLPSGEVVFVGYRTQPSRERLNKRRAEKDRRKQLIAEAAQTRTDSDER